MYVRTRYITDQNGPNPETYFSMRSLKRQQTKKISETGKTPKGPTT